MQTLPRLTHGEQPTAITANGRHILTPDNAVARLSGPDMMSSRPTNPTARGYARRCRACAGLSGAIASEVHHERGTGRRNPAGSDAYRNTRRNSWNGACERCSSGTPRCAGTLPSPR
jgi:hypothetical protein